MAFDSHSFAAAIKGEKGTPREWVYVELNGKSYARDARFKLTNAGNLLDLSRAPFEEIPVPKDTADSAAVKARKTLQVVLDEHPAKPGQDVKPAKKKQRQFRRKAEK